MVQRNSSPDAASRVAVPAPANDPEEIGLAELARAILAREIKRPRVGQVRRLAEAALAAEERRARKKAKPAGKKKADKTRKLARIPGQKTKK
ncbi:MAG: hypothetical protein ABIT16_08665 [Croceibacterium sp.]